MTKRHHSCAWCRQIAAELETPPEHRPSGLASFSAVIQAMGRADKDIVAEVNALRPAPMRSGAELEQEARQRVADFQRLVEQRAALEQLQKTAIQTEPQPKHFLQP